MMYALIRPSDNTVVKTYNRANIRIQLPGTGSQVSPLVDGWSGEGYMIKKVIPAVAPTNGDIITSRQYVVDANGNVQEQLTTEPREIKPPMSTQEKVEKMLGDYDLTIEELRQILLA